MLIPGELLTSAVLVGTSTADNINLVNAKSLASTKVNLVTTEGCCECVKVSGVGVVMGVVTMYLESIILSKSFLL